MVDFIGDVAVLAARQAAELEALRAREKVVRAFIDEYWTLLDEANAYTAQGKVAPASHRNGQARAREDLATRLTMAIEPAVSADDAALLCDEALYEAGSVFPCVQRDHPRTDTGLEVHVATHRGFTSEPDKPAPALFPLYQPRVWVGEES